MATAAAPPPPQLVDKKGQVWQERTVVVKRDQDGFGFTLSQQMPVFVDKIFEGSSAQRAGILPGDRIIKVGHWGSWLNRLDSSLWF